MRVHCRRMLKPRHRGTVFVIYCVESGRQGWALFGISWKCLEKAKQKSCAEFLKEQYIKYTFGNNKLFKSIRHHFLQLPKVSNRGNVLIFNQFLEYSTMLGVININNKI